MNEESIIQLIKDKMTIRISPHWGQFIKELKVELLLDGKVISEDSIAMDEIRSDFD